MAISKEEFFNWLHQLDASVEFFYADDGGLMLCAESPGCEEEDYIEIGGKPQRTKHCHCCALEYEPIDQDRFPQPGEHYVYLPTGELHSIDPEEQDPREPDADGPFVGRPADYEIYRKAD